LEQVIDKKLSKLILQTVDIQVDFEYNTYESKGLKQVFRHLYPECETLKQVSRHLYPKCGTLMIGEERKSSLRYLLRYI
jgi:hypothetical protein